MNDSVNTPKKGAARKWAERLKKMREQLPSGELLNILDQTEKPKKIAQRRAPHEYLDV